MKKVLVYGMATSGISTVKALDNMGYEIYTYDKNYDSTIEDTSLKGYRYSPISNPDKIFEHEYEFVVKSPGINPKDELYIKMKVYYEVINDIELSYRLFPDKKTVAITGTNGKTTTTSIVEFVLNKTNRKALAVGNIGVGILDVMRHNEAIFVEELSSFQLHEIKDYKSHIAVILNISPDHLDWHGDYEDYINSKKNIFLNQDENDILILNYDDKKLQNIKSKSKKIFFSYKKKLNNGCFYDRGAIFISKNGDSLKLLDVDSLKIVGQHNVSNAMAAILVLMELGVSKEEIAKYLKDFTACDYRLQYIDTVLGVRFYNDSKATNPDSTLNALTGFKDNLILILGGYDKNLDLTDVIKALKPKCKFVVLIGQTTEKFSRLCEQYDLNYYRANDMNDAFTIIKKNARAMDTVLLSPACASWDMYKNYEERGREFNELVKKFKERI